MRIRSFITGAPQTLSIAPEPAIVRGVLAHIGLRHLLRTAILRPPEPLRNTSLDRILRGITAALESGALE